MTDEIWPMLCWIWAPAVTSGIALLILIIIG
jgi:hypothetical protein